jgi:succinyl-CoA synthetase beta subunit
MKTLCQAFVRYDCSLAEINPLVITGSGEMVALDAKITFDDNALFRHKDLAELRDLSEEEPAEVRAGERRAELRETGRQHRLPGQRGRAWR